DATSTSSAPIARASGSSDDAPESARSRSSTRPTTASTTTPSSWPRCCGAVCRSRIRDRSVTPWIVWPALGQPVYVSPGPLNGNANSGVREWRTDVVAQIVSELGLEQVMLEAADPDVFSWYVKNYGIDVDLFVDHSQIVQLEC